jgi:hypothetical protein
MPWDGRRCPGGGAEHWFQSCDSAGPDRGLYEGKRMRDHELQCDRAPYESSPATRVATKSSCRSSGAVGQVGSADHFLLASENLNELSVNISGRTRARSPGNGPGVLALSRGRRPQMEVARSSLQRVTSRVSRILEGLGLERRRAMVSGRRSYFYAPASAPLPHCPTSDEKAFDRPLSGEENQP